MRSARSWRPSRAQLGQRAAASARSSSIAACATRPWSRSRRARSASSSHSSVAVARAEQRRQALLRAQRRGAVCARPRRSRSRARGGAPAAARARAASARRPPARPRPSPALITSACAGETSWMYGSAEAMRCEVQHAVDDRDRRAHLALAVELLQPRARLVLGRERDRVDDRHPRRGHRRGLRARRRDRLARAQAPGRGAPPSARAPASRRRGAAPSVSSTTTRSGSRVLCARSR